MNAMITASVSTKSVVVNSGSATHWVLVTEDDTTLCGVVLHPTKDDAPVRRALAEVLEGLAVQSPVLVSVDGPSLEGSTRVHVLTPGEGRAMGITTAASAQLIVFENARAYSRRFPLECATDASRKVAHRLLGLRSASAVAWVSADGRGSGRATSKTMDINLAELTALRDLLCAHPLEQGLRVAMDSRWAIEQVAKIRAGRTVNPNGEVKLYSTLTKQLRNRHVELYWVKGHDGDRLNEAADRLAVAARRAAILGNPSILSTETELVRSQLVH